MTERGLYSKVTCTEVVVCSVILALLVAISLVDISKPISMSKISKDAALVSQINVAVCGYYTEYGTLPLPAGIERPKGNISFGSPVGAPFTTVVPGTRSLFQGLSGNVNAYNDVATDFAITGLNKKNIVYISLYPNDVDKDGIPIQRFLSSGKNTYFSIKMKTTASPVLGGLPDRENGTFDLQLDAIVAVWCNNGEHFNTPNSKWSTSY